MDDRNAGLALIQAAIAMLIPFAIGYLVFRLVKPSTDYREKSPNDYGRLFLAHTLFYLFFGLGSLSFIGPGGTSGINFLVLLALAIPTVGPLSYFIGYLYGKSKPAASILAQEAKTSIKTTIEKSVKKPVKKTAEKPKEVITQNENTMDEEINDEEYYLIATKEVERSDRDDALWAKCMATQMGDETKAKYSYVNIRVAMFKQEEKDKAEQRKILEEKIRLEVYTTIERHISSNSRNPEHDLATNNLFPDSPNAYYKKKIIADFEQKVKERLFEQKVKERLG
jgi:hypothetical protein